MKREIIKRDIRNLMHDAFNRTCIIGAYLKLLGDDKERTPEEIKKWQEGQKSALKELEGVIDRFYARSKEWFKEEIIDSTK